MQAANAAANNHEIGTVRIKTASIMYAAGWILTDTGMMYDFSAESGGRLGYRLTGSQIHEQVIYGSPCHSCITGQDPFQQTCPVIRLKAADTGEKQRKYRQGHQKECPRASGFYGNTRRIRSIFNVIRHNDTSLSCYDYGNIPMRIFPKSPCFDLTIGE